MKARLALPFILQIHQICLQINILILQEKHDNNNNNKINGFNIFCVLSFPFPAQHHQEMFVLLLNTVGCYSHVRYVLQVYLRKQITPGKMLDLHYTQMFTYQNIRQCLLELTEEQLQHSATSERLAFGCKIKTVLLLLMST